MRPNESSLLSHSHFMARGMRWSTSSMCLRASAGLSSSPAPAENLRCSCSRAARSVWRSRRSLARRWRSSSACRRCAEARRGSSPAEAREAPAPPSGTWARSASAAATSSSAARRHRENARSAARSSRATRAWMAIAAPALWRPSVPPTPPRGSLTGRDLGGVSMLVPASPSPASMKACHTPKAPRTAMAQATEAKAERRASKTSCCMALVTFLKRRVSDARRRQRRIARFAAAAAWSWDANCKRSTAVAMSSRAEKVDMA
mmetsp:Transcript_14268/g.43325  ORF Transcript_14268/g.43325 Transcript_14268/m.43325 type:complete len:261 (+) Transcript_14268:647-1429(+)